MLTSKPVGAVTTKLAHKFVPETVKLCEVDTEPGQEANALSDAFVEIIMELYKNNDVSNLIKNLNTDERTLLNSIIYMAGLNKKIVTDTGKSLAGLKEQLKIIEGQIMAGNDNPEVLKELKEVLLKLNHLGAISLSGIKKYLKQFE